MSLPWSRDMELDPGTFGGTPACHILVDMMNHNVIPIQEKHRVLSFLSNMIFTFKELSKIESDSVKIRVMGLVKEDYFVRVAEMAYPDKFKSYLKNIVAYYFRRYLKEVA